MISSTAESGGVVGASQSPNRMISSTAESGGGVNRMVNSSAESESGSGGVVVAPQSPNGMISSSAESGGGFGAPQSPPWLMIRPWKGRKRSTVFRFWCFAQGNRYVFYDNNQGSRDGLTLIDWEYMYSLNGRYMFLVGSSQGWLIYRENCEMYLIDPTTYHCIHLPPLHGPLRDVKVAQLAPDGEEREGMMFMIFGTGHALAFCWPRRSREWTLFGGGFRNRNFDDIDDEVYESLVYSSTHRRLFCITSLFRLEAWDVEGDSPKRLWAAPLCENPYLLLRASRHDLIKFKYLVCEEQSGDLFLVVRYVVVTPTRLYAFYWSYDDTTDFEVYKIDPQLMKITLEDSLQGLSIFIGNNHPIAIKHVGVKPPHAAGVKPDSIYFTYDPRMSVHIIVSIFDYQNRYISRLHPTSATDTPVWFTPTPYIRCTRCI